MPSKLNLSFYYKEDLPLLAEMPKYLNYAKDKCNLHCSKVQAYIKGENKLEGIRIGAIIFGTLCLITAISCYCITIFVSLPVLISVMALAGLFAISIIVLNCVGDQIAKPLKELKELKESYTGVPFFHYIECVKLGDPDFLKTLGKNKKIDRQEVEVPNLNGKIINFIKRIFSQKSSSTSV